VARAHLSVVFAGSGGSGAMTAGSLLLRAAADAGYYGLMTKLFGAQVRGGEAAALVQISVDPVEYQPDRFDLFVALDWDKVDQFAPEIPLDQNSIIVADPETGAIPASIAKSKARAIAVAMGTHATKLEKAMRGKRSNIFAAALIATRAGLQAADLQKALDVVLGEKATDVVASNRASLADGIAAAGKLDLDIRMAPPKQAPRWLITGNEGIGLGALRGGVRFVGCYPITPATDLVEWLAPQLKKLGGKLVLAEDELASINMVLGASYGGAPAMTVTSGPGFSLMTEALGLAVAAEIPAVLVDVSAPAPRPELHRKPSRATSISRSTAVMAMRRGWCWRRYRWAIAA
jgi:2-oxoglutarate ferredoxin oxidoreductase subunit alpha